MDIPFSSMAGGYRHPSRFALLDRFIRANQEEDSVVVLLDSK